MKLHRLNVILSLCWINLGDNIRFRAGGLNHSSVLSDVRYVDSGLDAYEDVRARAEGYFGKMLGYSEILSASLASGHSVETEGWMDIDLSHIKDVHPWSDRWLFRDILDRFGCLPITYDSHFGEYIQWANDASDHRGILIFIPITAIILAKRHQRLKVFYTSALCRSLRVFSPTVDMKKLL